ncbi:uncharacterized protein Fot_19475 [Forsythia ovata]|uniref:DUF3456 domain-containing protein n=1 Tax=Forsythia ovata TaxID=205694 RepID=A0ABD1VL56_9LAMI
MSSCSSNQTWVFLFLEFSSQSKQHQATGIHHGSYPIKPARRTTASERLTFDAPRIDQMHQSLRAQIWSLIYATRRTSGSPDLCEDRSPVRQICASCKSSGAPDMAHRVVLRSGARSPVAQISYLNTNFLLLIHELGASNVQVFYGILPSLDYTDKQEARAHSKDISTFCGRLLEETEDEFSVLIKKGSVKVGKVGKVLCQDLGRYCKQTSDYEKAGDDDEEYRNTEL